MHAQVLQNLSVRRQEPEAGLDGWSRSHGWSKVLADEFLAQGLSAPDRPGAKFSGSMNHGPGSLISNPALKAQAWIFSVLLYAHML